MYKAMVYIVGRDKARRAAIRHPVTIIGNACAADQGDGLAEGVLRTFPPYGESAANA